MRFFSGLMAGLGIAALCGFGSYEPGQAEWQPEKPTVRETPRVTPFDFSKEVIDDGPIRCFVVNPRGSMPAIACVVLP